MSSTSFAEPSDSLLEVVLRVVAIYMVMLVLIRISNRRHVGKRSPTELLTMLLLAGAVGPALTAYDPSIATMVTVAVTLLATNSLVAFLTYRSRTAEWLLIGAPHVLIERGALDRDVVAREKLTRQELEQALRTAGVESVDDVEKACLEPDGDITVVPRPKQDPAPSRSSSRSGSS